VVGGDRDHNPCLTLTLILILTLGEAADLPGNSRKQAVEGPDPEKCVRDPAIWALRCGTLVCQFSLTPVVSLA
jgi:hypothetical protein